MVSRYLNWVVNQQFYLHCTYLSKCSFCLLQAISIKMYKENVQKDSDSESLSFAVSAFQCSHCWRHTKRWILSITLRCLWEWLNLLYSFSRPAGRTQVFCSSIPCPLQTVKRHVKFSFTDMSRWHCNTPLWILLFLKRWNINFRKMSISSITRKDWITLLLYVTNWAIVKSILFQLNKYTNTEWVGMPPNELMTSVLSQEGKHVLRKSDSEKKR